MSDAFRNEMVTFTKLVSEARLSPDAAHSVLWCVNQLPNLCDQFVRTYESRYADEISRVERGVLQKLDAEATTNPEAPKLAERLLEQIQILHERMGLPRLDCKAKEEKRGRKTKAA
jgi:hypothetical protein